MYISNKMGALVLKVGRDVYRKEFKLKLKNNFVLWVLVHINDILMVHGEKI